MRKRDLEHYIQSFFSKSNFEEFFFIEQEELENLYNSYKSEIKKACCGSKRRVKNKYSELIKSKFEDYS